MKLLAPLALAVGVNSFQSPFVINKDDVIYRGQTGKSLNDVKWTALAGRLVDIGCNSNDQCWGAAADGTTWFTEASDPSKVNWQRKHANFKAVAISAGNDGSVWAVDSNNQIWRSYSLASPWEFVNGLLVDVAAVSFNEAWGVGVGSNTIWHQSPERKAGNWKEVQAWHSGLARISVCNNGEIYATASDYGIYRGIRLEGPSPVWYRLGGGATDIACKNNNAYVIGTGNDDIWVRDQWNARRNDYWHRIPGAAVRIG